MLQGAIKQNTHTQAIARHYLVTMHNIIDKLGITKYDWNALLFEYGMQYLWNCYGTEDAREIATTETGFWDTWLENWAADDEMLLAIHTGYGYSYSQYIMDKLELTKKPSITS